MLILQTISVLLSDLVLKYVHKHCTFLHPPWRIPSFAASPRSHGKFVSFGGHAVSIAPSFPASIAGISPIDIAYEMIRKLTHLEKKICLIIIIIK